MSETAVPSTATAPNAAPSEMPRAGSAVNPAHSEPRIAPADHTAWKPVSMLWP
jgi:hypothetical protein